LIFVTVGSMLPFDRMVRAVDELAPSFPDQRFRAQVGEAVYAPVNMAYDRRLTAKDFGQAVADCTLMVAHAGMGSILTAAEAGKPVVILPRRLADGEILTDHQIATARRLGERPGVYLAMDEGELGEAIARALADGGKSAGLGAHAPAAFLDRIKDFIHTD
jgi:UDP-N-acetylglucosamine transferase subunit ALG13